MLDHQLSKKKFDFDKAYRYNSALTCGLFFLQYAHLRFHF